MIYKLFPVERGRVPFNNAPILLRNSCFLCNSLMISSASHGSSFSSSIVLRNGLARIPGLEFIPGVRIPGLLLADADRDASFVTGVFGGTLDLEQTLSVPGDPYRTPLTACTLFSSATTFVDRICKRENTLLTTR